ncbi:MAG TPA: aspartate aminotransferase family protein [Terriglobia bacterium]|nr:aspartate aminotransferase family protein [Terriglobia bacterium]
MKSTLSPSTGEVLFNQACEVIPGGVTSAARKMTPPIVFRAGEGAYLVGVDGKRYLDYHAAFGPVLLGHNHPEVNRRVAEALRSAPLPGAGVTELEIAVAQKIHRHVPCAERVQLCGSGSEAVFNALRVARAFTGRPKILKFDGCYHGTYDSVLANTPQASVSAERDPRSRTGRLAPGSAGILPETLAHTLVCAYNSLEEVQQTLETNRNQVAAIIVEPIAHNMGSVLPRPGFLEGLRDLAVAHGALLIFDEVITGFRHHLGGYQALGGVRPDLATFGKAIANGFPLAAIAGRADVMDHFNTREGGDTCFAGTYHGHPAALAAALATMEILENQPVHERIFALGDRLRRGLFEIHLRLGTGATVAGFGSIFVTYFTSAPIGNYADALRSDAARFLRYRRAMIERGVFLIPSNLKRGHIGFSHTGQDIDRTLQIAEDVLRTASDAAPASPAGGRAR